MAEELMLKVEDVYKKYRLGTIGGGTLTADLQSWWAKVRHKEDPNSKIGAKTYGKNEVFYALNGVSFEVRKGEALGIIGGNGAGKSTTLKLISQVTAPTKGKIYLNGRITSMLEVGTGFHPELTGRENIYLNGAILGMTKAEIDAKIEEIIDFSECRKFIDTPVKRYSSGMYVKLAFSVAAHLDSEIMIMDEVLAVGDMAFQKKCINKMKSVARNECRTILYVSHNMNTIRQLCDRCVVLDKGGVIFEGDVEDSIEKYMNRNSIELKNKYVFDGQCRSTADRGTKIYIHDFEFADRNVARYFSSEKMLFSILLEGKEKLTGLRVRLEIRTGDEINVGMSESLPLIDIDKGEIKRLKMEYDISNLAEGTYTIRLTLFHLNEMGTHYGYDETTEPVFFEIVNDNEDGTNWMPQYWGHIRLPSVQLIEEKSI